MLSYSGVDTAAPIGGSSGLGVALSLPGAATLPVTTTVANTMLVTFFGHANGGGTLSTPLGMTFRTGTAITGAGPNGVKIRATDQTIAAIGSTGARTSTSTNSAFSTGHAVVLRPGGANAVINWREP
jgi:hypothetical protein